jgi:hypothetical protein
MTEIRIGPDIERVNDAAIAALRSRQGLYQRGGQMVEVVAGRLRTVGKARLREILSAVARWVLKDGTPTIPPGWAPAGILARGEWGLPLPPERQTAE